MRNQLLVLCLVVSGCSFDIKTCTTDDDCVAGGYCGEGGFCVAREEQTGGGAGGGGGAQTTGGGSGGIGGGAGGGIVDAGFDAGIACANRPVPCPVGFECRETSQDTTACELAFTSMDVTVADGGAIFNSTMLPVRFVLVRKIGFNTADEPSQVSSKLTLPDGGVWFGTAGRFAGGFTSAFFTSGDGDYSAAGFVDLTNEDGGVERVGSLGVSFTVDTTPPVLAVTPP